MPESKSDPPPESKNDSKSDAKNDAKSDSKANGVVYIDDNANGNGLGAGNDNGSCNRNANRNANRNGNGSLHGSATTSSRKRRLTLYGAIDRYDAEEQVFDDIESVDVQRYLPVDDPNMQGVARQELLIDPSVLIDKHRYYRTLLPSGYSADPNAVKGRMMMIKNGADTVKRMELEVAQYKAKLETAKLCERIDVALMQIHNALMSMTSAKDRKKYRDAMSNGY
jgi:hypothetical protein